MAAILVDFSPRPFAEFKNFSWKLKKVRVMSLNQYSKIKY